MFKVGSPAPLRHFRYSSTIIHQDKLQSKTFCTILSLFLHRVLEIERKRIRKIVVHRFFNLNKQGRKHP